MTMSTNLGWPSEPEPGPEHRRLGWLARMLGVSRETAGAMAVNGEDGHPGVDDGTGLHTGEAPATSAGPSPADDLRASNQATEPTSAAEAPGATSDMDLAGSSPRPERAVAVEGALEDDLTSSPLGNEAPAEPPRPLAATPSVGASAPPSEAPEASEQTTANTEEARESPVDNAVDEASEIGAVERGIAPPEAGDNIVDDGSGARSAATSGATSGAPGANALAEPKVPPGDAEHTGQLEQIDRADRADRADRDALAAAIPTPGEDTPLARELAENARRRIQLTGRRFPKPASPRVLTVANQKGGVGKTTTTVNIAAALAQSGLKALVIDLDPQGNASTALGIDHHAEVPSIYDVLVDGTKLLDVIQPCTTVENLFCAPATIDLAGAEIELVSLVARESRLEKAIAAAGQEGHEFDYILIDCPPSLGLLTVNAMVAASEVFIPIQCEYYALEGLSQLLKNIDLVRVHLNPSLHVSTILLTMYDGRTRLSAQVADEVREHFPEQVLRTTVPRSVRVSEAPSFGETVMTYDPASSGALAYLEAASEIADRGAAGRT